MVLSRFARDPLRLIGWNSCAGFYARQLPLSALTMASRDIRGRIETP
jgi:hypothetical protein